MKIYNEVISQFNELTGKWETVSENSFNYGGEIALAQGVPPQSTVISAEDTIADTIKTTAGYFTGGDGTLSGTDIFTGSLSDSNEKYYFNVNNKNDETDATSVTQFSVTFGHIAGSGSNQFGDSTDDPKTIIGETQAIYKQYTNILLNPIDIEGGFTISKQGSKAKASTRDDFIYILNAKRNLYKDRINKKALNIALSGSNSFGSGSGILRLTDDSAVVAGVSTPAGLRYNIVSGTLGNPTGSDAYLHRTYGWFYPERGVVVFSGAELSASIPGGPHFGATNIHPAANAKFSASAGSNTYSASGAVLDITGLSVGSYVQITSASSTGNTTVTGQIIGGAPTTAGFTASCAWTGTNGHPIAGSVGISASLGIRTTDITASFSTTAGIRASSSGFAPNLDAHRDSNNALRLVNCLRNIGSENAIQFRSEEDVTKESYFCRIKSADYNFSNNPTFVSGGLNKIRNITMHGNTTTFITGVGLYNSAGQLLAIASLSRPLIKNFVSEATIKVQLTY